MNLIISPVFACLASTAATHGNAEESTETNICSRPSTGLDNDDSIETDFAIWNDLLDTLQVPMQNDNAHSSAYDSECMGITELNLPQNGVTYTVKYKSPPGTKIFDFPKATLEAAFQRAVNCPVSTTCTCKATNDLFTVYYPHKSCNSEQLYGNEKKLCEFPIRCLLGKPESSWCGSPTTGLFRLVYKYSTSPKKADFFGMMYHPQDDRECPSGKAGCFKECTKSK